MATATRSRKAPRKHLSPEARAQLNTKRADEVAALTAGLVDRIEQLADSDDWAAVLNATARFHQYSFRNVLLLLIQAEERGMTLGRVASYRTWQAMGRQVRKGEMSLKVVAPVPFKVRDEEGNEVLDDDGKPKRGRRFKLESVFDESQTDGDPVAAAPAIPGITAEAPEGLGDYLVELIEDAGYEVREAGRDELGRAEGVTKYDEQLVLIGEHLTPAERVHCLAHELAHIRCDHENRRGDDVTREQRETEADATAYVVCAAMGLDSLEFSAAYVTGWSNGDGEILGAALERIVSTSRAIIAQVRDLAGVDDEDDDTDEDEA